MKVQKCVEDVHYLSNIGGNFLRFNVFTRWNLICMILESIIYRLAFTSLS